MAKMVTPATKATVLRKCGLRWRRSRQALRRAWCVAPRALLGVCRRRCVCEPRDWCFESGGFRRFHAGIEAVLSDR